ncbi:MAG: hypothetical protein RR234_02750 [Christensenella sp.]
MKKIINKANKKMLTGMLNAKASLANNAGMELIQVLVVSILAIVVGSLLLTTMKGQFTTHLATLGTKLTEMFK